MKIIVSIGILAFAFSCSNDKLTNPTITGLWKLEIMKVRDTTTNTWSDYKGGMDGYLLYDGTGHVALHLYEKGYEKA